MSEFSQPDRPLQFLVDAVTDTAIYMLDLEGRVVTWNTGAERVKGYAREEVIGEPFAQFFTLEDRMAGVPAQILRRAATDGKVETEGWRVRKDGSRFWSRAALHAVRD